MKIGAIKILISECTEGIYLRWWFNGWHYFNFTNGYDITMQTESMGTQTTRFFSVISKIERPTRLKSEYAYSVVIEGIPAYNVGGFLGLLMAEKVSQLEGGIWREVDITRGSHILKSQGQPGYELTFEITRKEIPGSSSVYHKSLRLYIGDILCDMDDDEIVPINKQTNDIAEMQDRQSDFTAQFRVRKTRTMRALFELSGEVGANTTFPYEEQTCKLIQDNIEVITGGTLILERVDEQYYYVSIQSGNKNFFKSIESLKITDLTLAGADHTWNVATMAGTHAADLDYVYPLCEPSDDGSIAPLTDDGDSVELYGGWIWPFVNVKAIWDEIFSNAGYIVEGDILTDPIFSKLFMPIVNRNIANSIITTNLYSGVWTGRHDFTDTPSYLNWNYGIVNILNGDIAFTLYAKYNLVFDATYKFAVDVFASFDDGQVNACYLYIDGILEKAMDITYNPGTGNCFYECEYDGLIGDQATFHIDPKNAVLKYAIKVLSITQDSISYGSVVTPHINLPDMGQIDFIKMICNMFALIPDVTPKDRKIRFWNYGELYDNIPNARDWSTYLSERDDETEFKFGDYAQNNWLRYRESEDVVIDEGAGAMQIDDETLPNDKEVVELPLSTCDRVIILESAEFGVEVSRINFNTWNIDDAVHEANNTIDPRIVYVDHTQEVASPAYEKVFTLRETEAPGGATTDIDSPKKASSIEVSFGALVPYAAFGYSYLSRLLTKTNLRRAKFNLPVYEVAGLKHYIPIYLSQYKAYFYVNKINNYVPGQLCTIDLIKL